MTLNLEYFFVLILIFLNPTAGQKKIPSNTDIEDYDDPVLREIFKTKTQPQRFNPDPSPHQTQSVVYPQSSQTTYNQVPTSQPSIYQPTQHPYYSQNYNQSPQGQDFTNLAAQGAATFYTGAQRVSQAFGIQPYQNQYFNYAASLFG